MKKIFYLNILIVLILSFNSCVDSSYDNNIEIKPTEIKPTHSIRAFLAAVKRDTIIKEDYVIKGTVVSSDAQSNFYKELYLQDSTGQIKLSIERYGLYLDFWLGHEYVLKLKGLSYNSQYSSICIYGKDTRLPNIILKDHLFWAGKSKIDTIAPKVMTVSTISDSDIGKLVTINNATIKEAGQTYGYPDDKVNKGTKDCTITDATGSMILSNSSYANFSRAILPGGNKNITGVITKKYNSKYYLVIRNTNDIK